jgi:hypothetical protein
VTEEKLGKLLNELAQRTAEAVRPELAEDIKHQIPHRLMPRTGGMNTINVMIDLRISKLAAAAVIIITLVLCASFLGGRDLTDDGIYKDGKLLIKYCLGGISADKGNVLAAKSKYEYLTKKGEEVAYYGDSIDPEDSNAVLMQWKLPNGRYKVIFGDLREKTVSTEELIKLQTQMLQKAKK